MIGVPIAGFNLIAHIAYAQKPPLSAFVNLSSVARGLVFGPSLLLDYFHTFFQREAKAPIRLREDIILFYATCKLT